MGQVIIVKLHCISIIIPISLSVHLSVLLSPKPLDQIQSYLLSDLFRRVKSNGDLQWHACGSAFLAEDCFFLPNSAM